MKKVQQQRNFNLTKKSANVLFISLPYNILISIWFLFTSFVLTILFYLNSRLSSADKAIQDLQKQSLFMNTNNQKLLENLTEITYKNSYLEKLVGDMQIENNKLLNTITALQETLAGIEDKRSTLSEIDPIFWKIALGTVLIGGLAYGGFALTNIIIQKYPGSSVGLWLTGLDKKLIWLGTKLKIIDTSTNQTYLDKFSNNYQVILDNDVITEILIDNNGKFIDVGVYINDLLRAIAQNQTTAVNMATQPVTNSSLDLMSVLARNSAPLENVTSVTETLSNFTI